ncbi:MAG: 50S ribosomal protein L31e [Candidatus Pacearchaeota archaeon]
MVDQKQKIEKEEKIKTEIVENKESTKESLELQKEKPKKINLPLKSKKDVKEEKIELERVYVVPLRKGFLKVPQYKRAKKAVKTLKEFLAKHMKVEDRDLNKVKIDIYLNNEIWFRGIKKPLSKIKVKAKKINGIVYAELEDVPDYVKWIKQKDDKKKTKVDKKALDKVVTQEASKDKIKQERSNKENQEKIKQKDNIETTKVDSAKKVTQVKSTKIDNLSTTTQRKTLKK